MIVRSSVVSWFMLLQADGHAVTVFVFHFSSHSEAEVATIWCAV